MSDRDVDAGRSPSSWRRCVPARSCRGIDSSRLPSSAARCLRTRRDERAAVPQRLGQPDLPAHASATPSSCCAGRRSASIAAGRPRHAPRVPRAVDACGSHFDRAPAGLPVLRRPRRRSAPTSSSSSTAPARSSGRRAAVDGPPTTTSAGAIGFAVVDALADLHLVDPQRMRPRRPRPARRLRRAPGRRLAQALGPRRRRAHGQPMMDAVADAPARRRCRRRRRVAVLHNDFKLDNCQFDPGRPRSGEVDLRLGHGDARRSARRPRHAAQLLARSRRHARRPAAARAGHGAARPAHTRRGRRALRERGPASMSATSRGTRPSPVGRRASCSAAVPALRARREHRPTHGHAR